MNELRLWQRLPQHLPELIAALLISVVLLACDAPGQTTSNAVSSSHMVITPPSSFPFVTAIASAPPLLTSTPPPISTAAVAATATTLAFRARAMGTSPQIVADDDALPTQAASDDIVVRNYSDMLTQSALTPPPTFPADYPTDTPAPIPTLGPGLYQCPSLPNMQHNVPISCGYWLVNDNLVGAKAGRRGRSADVRQGYIEVACIGRNTASYDTPAMVGAVRVNEVQGTRFILGAADGNAKPNTFVFDIATCQWVSP